MRRTKRRIIKRRGQRVLKLESTIRKLFDRIPVNRDYTTNSEYKSMHKKFDAALKVYQRSRHKRGT